MADQDPITILAIEVQNLKQRVHDIETRPVVTNVDADVTKEMLHYVQRRADVFLFLFVGAVSAHLAMAWFRKN